MQVFQLALFSEGAFNPEWIENLPVARRHEFIRMLSDHIKQRNEEVEARQKANQRQSSSNKASHAGASSVHASKASGR